MMFHQVIAQALERLDRSVGVLEKVEVPLVDSAPFDMGPKFRISSQYCRP